MNTKREFIIKELMEEKFVEHDGEKIYLEETEDTGKSFLEFQLESKENISIKNVDKNPTQLLFFKKEKNLSMYKRVDHIIFECIEDNNWKLHLIEMKSSVGTKKWTDIKGKFRASYLLAQAIAAMLEMNIAETCMYTTYDKVSFDFAETMPVGRRLLLGIEHIKPQDEWNGDEFGLNFGTRVKFNHMPIKMIRNAQGVLEGQFACG